MQLLRRRTLYFIKYEGMALDWAHKRVISFKRQLLVIELNRPSYRPGRQLVVLIRPWSLVWKSRVLRWVVGSMLQEYIVEGTHSWMHPSKLVVPFVACIHWLDCLVFILHWRYESWVVRQIKLLDRQSCARCYAVIALFVHQRNPSLEPLFEFYVWTTLLYKWLFRDDNMISPGPCPCWSNVVDLAGEICVLHWQIINLLAQRRPAVIKEPFWVTSLTPRILRVRRTSLWRIYERSLRLPLLGPWYRAGCHVVVQIEVIKVWLHLGWPSAITCLLSLEHLRAYCICSFHMVAILICCHLGI